MVKPDIQNIHPSEEEKNLLISLQDAAKIYGYTQHHFGLLCRQGKLKSERKGKKWLTTRTWIEEYLGTLEEHYKSANNHYTNGFERIQVSVAVPEPEVVKPREEIPVFLFSGDGFLESPFSEIPPKSDFKEIPKSDFKSSRPKYFFPKLKPEPASNKVACGLAFSLAAIVLFVYLFNAGFLPKEYISGVANVAKNFTRERVSNTVLALVSDAGDAVVKFSDFSKMQNRASVFAERTKNNFQSFFSGIRSAVYEMKDFVLDPKTKLIGFGRLVRLAFEYKEQILPPQETETVEPQLRDGLVVFPSGENVSKETAIKMVKDSFSDEVIVRPDEDGDSGIIQPVFKKGKGGEYIYVMVPAKQQKVENVVEEKNKGP